MERTQREQKGPVCSCFTALANAVPATWLCGCILAMLVDSGMPAPARWHWTGHAIYTVPPRCEWCPEGHWCSGGVKYECAAGSYNPMLGQTSEDGCTKCPCGSWSGGRRLTVAVADMQFVPHRGLTQPCQVQDECSGRRECHTLVFAEGLKGVAALVQRPWLRVNNLQASF